MKPPVICWKNTGHLLEGQWCPDLVEKPVGAVDHHGREERDDRDEPATTEQD